MVTTTEGTRIRGAQITELFVVRVSVQFVAQERWLKRIVDAQSVVLSR